MTLSKVNVKDVDYFGKLGIGKWGKQELPILVVNPLNLPKDWPVYQQWKNRVDKVRKHVLSNARFACPTPLLIQLRIYDRERSTSYFGMVLVRTTLRPFLGASSIISLNKECVVQRLEKVLAKPKNSTNGALRRSFEELKPDLDKSEDELQRKFEPENKRPAARKRRPSPKADNWGKRRLRGPVVEKRIIKSMSPKEPCLPVWQSVSLALRKSGEDFKNEDGCEQQAIAGEDQMQSQPKEMSLDKVDVIEVEMVHQPQAVPTEGQTQPEPLEMASQPPIPNSEDPVDAEPRLQQTVIASEDQTRAQPKVVPPKQNQKAAEENKTSSKKAGKPQDSSRRGEYDRCIARKRVADENGDYGPPKDIWLSELEARKNGIQEYSIQMQRGGHLRFIGGMVSPEQCKDLAKEMETIEYRRYPLKGLNALEPRVHLLLSKAANSPANKPTEKKSMDSQKDSEEDPDHVDGECQDDFRVQSLPETAIGYKYHR